jgi:hypothetical protein
VDSEKNETISQKSHASKVPSIQTKFKAITKKDAAAEVKIAQSQRFSLIAEA